MEILRSNVMNSIENVEDKPALGGLFGSEGFFFQQRRGHLDLRSIAAINLEKLVREVDVDVLQIHIENITFCNLREEDLRYLTDPQIVKLFRISQLMLEYLLYSQDKLVDNLNNLSHKYSEKKRGLSKKRRELVELEESTKLLRNQVKAKKQNIATLEDLLKEANRTREKELRKLRMQKGAEMPNEKPSIVKFFIAGPEGLCVEFVEKAETEISQLLREARKAFISMRDHDYSYDPNLVEIRLVFKGRLLLPEQTIEECDIREGDTLMAMLVEPKKPETVVSPPASLAPAAVDPEGFTRQMFEIMSKQNQEQMREIVQDINSGWKTALETISANNKPVVIEREREPASQVDNQALADMQGRWSRSELALQLKLEEVQHKQAMSDQELSALQILAMRRRMKLGDLESDDEPPVRREAPAAAAPAPGLDTGLFMGRIERVEHQTTYTSIDVERMRAELDELKRLMALRPEPTTIYVTTPAAPAPEPVKPKEFRVVTSEPEIVKTRSNKWDTLQNVKSAAPVQAPAPVPVVAPKAVVFEMEPAPKPVEVQLPVQEPPVKPPVKAAKPVPIPKPEPVVEVVPEPLGDVEVGFPAQFNPELAVLLGTKEPFYVTVPADIPVDDLLFELRKAASTKTRTKFAKVALEYKGQRALLGIDLGDDGAEMTAQTARTAAAAGDLRLVMMPGHPLTNAQIDMLVPSWEKNKVFTASGVSASEDENRGKSTVGNKARLKKKREWDDGDSAMRQSGASVQSNADEDDKMDPATLERGVYRQMRTSLDEALSEISEKEGLTDDELQRRIAKMKDDSDTLPKEVSDHLKNYKGSMVGALAAAAADSGSDTAGATLAGTDEMLRTSTGVLSARDGMLSRSVSMSLSLPRREGSFGSTGNLLRMSGASARSSPGLGQGDNLSMSMSSLGSKTRRSVQQFDDEDGLNSDNLLEDTPMLASLTSSTDFRRQTAAPTRVTPTADKPPARVTSGVGIAQPSSAAELEMSRTAASLSSTLNVDSDSLMYSPAGSVSVRPSTARSRYSTEGNESEEEEEELVQHLDMHHGAARQPPAKPARHEAQEDFRGRWAKHDVDTSAEEEEEGASWAAAGRPVDISAQSFGDEPEYRADAKNAADRRDGEGKLVDSVDSFKREYRAGKNAREEGGFKGEMSVTESDDRFRNTGDYTAMSSIPTLNETVTTFGDQDASYFRNHEGMNTGTHTQSSLGNTGHSDLTSTGESDGDVLHPRAGVRGGAGGTTGGARGRSNSRSNNVQSFHDDEGSINSLALSDSNNLDD